MMIQYHVIHCDVIDVHLANMVLHGFLTQNLSVGIFGILQKDGPGASACSQLSRICLRR